MFIASHHRWHGRERRGKRIRWTIFLELKGRGRARVTESDERWKCFRDNVSVGNFREAGCSASFKGFSERVNAFIVQELCESRGGRPGLSVLTSLLVSVDVKIY